VDRAAFRIVVCACLATAGSAFATPGGTGRITIQPSWRLTGNDVFANSASNSGHSLIKTSPGGPGLFATGAYAITSELEVEISLFGGAEQLYLNGLPTLTSITYGGLVGLRVGISFWEDRIRPTVFAGTGVGLVLAMGAGMPGMVEKLTQPWAFGLGLAINIAPTWDLNFDYRLLIGSRGFVTDVGSFNGGGSWFSIGVSYLFAPEPGYTSKPNLPEYEGTGMHSF
jgi:hypothetical protein